MFYILASLTHGPSHGYAIAKDVEVLSEGEVSIAIGNLYTALKQLLGAGLIERDGVADDREAKPDRRKLYRISARGKEAVEAELERLARMVRAPRPLRATG